MARSHDQLLDEEKVSINQGFVEAWCDMHVVFSLENFGDAVTRF